MTTLSVTSLFTVETAASLFEKALDVARVVGLPVTSWRTGDPTRSLYKFLANTLASLEAGPINEYIKSGFLSSAEGDWLTVLAYEVYGVERDAATYATPTITVTNTGGGYYELVPNDLTFKSSASGKTYHNTDSQVLSAGLTVTFALEADEPGSDSAVTTDEIDDFVTTLLGVTIDSSTAATARDAQSDESLREECRATLGALSPNGPPDAYEYVVLQEDLTGVTDITRSDSTEDAVDGTLTVYVAGASGGVLAASVVAAQAAVDTWATPLTVTPTVVNAVAQPIAFAGTVDGNDIPASFAADSENAITSLLADTAIGGVVARSAIISAIHTLLVDAGATDVSVVLSSPAADVDVDAGKVPTIGSFTLTEI